MKQIAIRIAEDEVQAAVANHLQRIKRQLEERGLRVESEPISREGAGDEYASEMRIYFWRGQDLYDVLEFHIARGGEIVADKADIETWLPLQLNPILDRSR